MELASELTADQLRALADQLRGTRRNIYTVAEQVLGPDVSVEDEVFEDLANYFGIFHCEHCEVWRPVYERSEYDEETCEDCE